MRVKNAKDRGVVKTEEEYNEKNAINPEWVEAIGDCIQRLSTDGICLPKIAKISHGKKVQLQTHPWLLDRIQGYWERHNSPGEYASLANVHAMMHYRGAIITLKEEQVTKGVGNSEDIDAIQKLVETNAPRHKALKLLANVTHEIDRIIEEWDNGAIDEDEYEASYSQIREVYSSIVGNERAAWFMGNYEEEAQSKMTNRKRVSKHRSKAKLRDAQDKGWSVLDGNR